MGIEYRSDRGQLVRYAPAAGGGIRVDAALTRIGVFEYRTADGKVSRELKGPASVLSAEALSTLKDAPVTVDHPREFVDASSWKQHSVGHVSADPMPGEDPERPGTIVGSLIVNDQAAIDAIDAGSLKEVSLGYYATIVDESGVYDGQDYDRVQLDPVYNHVALGGHDWGRLGPEISLRINRCDAAIECVGAAGMVDPLEPAESRTDTAPAIERRRNEEIMKPIVKLEGDRVRVDGVAFALDESGAATASEALACAIERARKDAPEDQASAVNALAEASEEVLRLARENARLSAELEQARSYDVSALVAERAKLMARCNSVAPDFEVGETMSNADAMAGALKAAGLEIADGASEEYLRGVMDHYKPSAAPAQDLSGLASAPAAPISLIEEAERKRNEHVFNSWKRARGEK